MNKELFQEWKIHPVTKLFIKHAQDAQQEVLERSSVRETADLTAMQTSRDEGVHEGVDALCVFIEDMILEYGNEESDNE